MKLGIRGKLFLFSLGLIVLTVVVAYGYMRSALEAQVEQSVHDDLVIRADLVEKQASGMEAPLDEFRAELDW